jgi:hypothetical protein
MRKRSNDSLITEQTIIISFQGIELHFVISFTTEYRPVRMDERYWWPQYSADLSFIHQFRCQYPFILS